MSTRKPTFILAGVFAVALPSFAADPTKEQLDFFEGKIRPILAEHCYKCHSVEATKSKGGLTLDTADATKKGGDTGPGVVPGKPEDSMIYKAVIYTDKDLAMPPSSSGGKLDAKQIADITEWIKMGAPDPRKEPAKAAKLSGLTPKAKAHWAYQPIKPYTKVKLPVNKNQAWRRTPIDDFILQKLEAQKMLASPDTDAETLLRRGYFDLIGMPPSPAEVEAFVADYGRDGVGAWARVVDKLLASPHYGERWGRHWLDSARYADTIGGDFNNNNMRTDYRYANAWTYRDYVIRALNEDKPYDQFITEQLAADYLYPLKPVGSASKAEIAAQSAPKTTPVALKPAQPMVADPFLLKKKTPPTPKAAIAQIPTAPAQPQPSAPPPMMASDSMMMGGSTAGGGTGQEMEGNPNLAALGFLTVGMRFNEPNDVINDRIDVMSKGFLGLTVACARCHDHMFDPIPQADYYSLHGIFASSAEPSDKPLIAESSPGLSGDYDKKIAAVEKENRDIYYGEVEHWLSMLQAKPAEYLKACLLRKGRNQNAVELDALVQKAQLNRDFVNYFDRSINQGSRVYGPLVKLQGVSSSNYDSELKDLQKSGRYNPLVVEALVKAAPQSSEQVLAVYNSLLTRMAPKTAGMVKAFKNATGETITGYSKDEIELLSGPFPLIVASKANTDWVRDSITGWNNRMTGRAKFVFAKINELELTNPGAPVRAMVLLDKPNPQDSRLLLRGQKGTPGDVVPRRFLSILSPNGQGESFKNGSGRLELAKAIANKDNPLTPRVLVNRVWLHHFGEGFVRTPDDLGVMSEKPSHPELIDYLASWFVDENAGNWSVKRLHKFIMLSRVYQASSKTRPEYETIDPDNRLLWRANVRRLDFEAFRDSLLVMSGRLDPKMGGQPVNITDEPYIFRRSIYGYIDRGNVPELMQHFDFSDPDMPNSKRTATIVPQQSLFLMNSPMAIDVARRVVARSEFQRADNDLRRVFSLYRIMFQRQPKPDEIKIAINFVQREKQNLMDTQGKVNTAEFAKKNAEAQKKVEASRNRNDAKKAIQNEGEIVERKPLTPWESYAHALLFANEAAYFN